MNSINVCFTASNRLFSRLIRKITRAEVSHALITFHDPGFDKVFVMEANRRGFVMVTWKRWSKTHKLYERYSLDVGHDIQVQALREIADDLGAPYDFRSLIGFLPRLILDRIRNPFSSSTKLVCSEVIAKFLYKCGLFRFEDIASWTPGDIIKEARGGKPFLLAEKAS